MDEVVRPKIDPKLFARDMKMTAFVGYDPYNSHDSVVTLQEDIKAFERAQDEEFLSIKE